ncbi:MAG: MBL fold metallo-hydrolase [Deltaproteobacteria bacterium]|nr:MBL fold metallo-hydrolase [Deltaproteobacteria bacterium]
MEIKFWGTRGSIPAPGTQTLEFGGNTTCVEVVLANRQRVVIDGGTGLRLLGQHLMENQIPCQFHLLLTHGHWDHLLGIPFFEPIYRESTKVIVDGWPPAFQAMTRVFDSHMGDGFFPVAFDHLKANIDYLNTLANGPLDLDGVLIDSIRLNHPQGGLGFRFREGKQTMVFVTDNELGAARGRRIPEFVEFVRGCDLLIHDAQYLPEEISARRGWGHSAYDEVVALAKEAEVHNLLFTHHDPSRSDAGVEKIVTLAREMMAAPGKPRYIDAAREGACYRLP